MSGMVKTFLVRSLKPDRPTRPDVKQPPAWTWASQEILTQSRWKARELMAEENGAAYDPKVVGLSIFGLENAFDDRLCDGDLKREFYERSLHFIGSESPKSGASSYGLPVDRAHARLWLWLKMWAGY